MTPEDRRRFSRLLSSLADATVDDALAMADAPGGDLGNEGCCRIGITGPPGAGKSSLIASLARARLRADGTLAVIAIDPTSPISGGAILGDRIRMADLATDPRIFIRSLATRASLDGLADNLPDILAAVERAGFAEVLVETVGVGQVEYAVGALVDTTVLVLPPGAGDQVQAMKSGILEKADIYVVNKADLPGARQLAAELRAVTERRPAAPGAWTPPIVPASLTDTDSAARLAAEIDRHGEWARASGVWATTRQMRRAHHAGSLLVRRVGELLRDMPSGQRQQPVAELYHALARQLACTCAVSRHPARGHP